MNRVAGKTAIVSGAASTAGIGFATASLLLREGARVVLTDISAGEVRARANELDPGHQKVLPLRHDISCEQSWESVIAETIHIFGGLDILVNNAGVVVRETIHDMDLDVWNRTVAVNQTGVFLGCKHGIRAMTAQGRGGAIVNIASTSAIRGVVRSGAYGSSKSAVCQLTRVAAIEGAAANIRCNAVLPGLIRSDMHHPIMEKTPDLYAALVESVPMSRLGDPEDIAHAILYLASDDARFVTGAQLVVDGGMTA